MKIAIIALAFITVLGFAHVTDAKGAGLKKHGKGMHGKIDTVSATSFTMTVGGKKNPHTMTVKFDANTTITIDGLAGKIDASQVGKRATIVGSANGDTISATAVTIKASHHHKKKAA